MNEWLENGDLQGYESIPEIESEVLVQPEITAIASNVTKLSMPLELPMSTPSTKESSQNFLH